MRICSIASSSSGNCIYVGTGTTHILLDSGISCKRLNAGLAAIDVDPASIDAILITHEHSDHIKGLGVVSRRYGIPIYATSQTWHNTLLSGRTGEIDKTLHREIIPDTCFTINELAIHPFRTSHDAAEPVSYTFTKDKKKISVATDLGCYDNRIAEHLKNSDILFIEANHDVEMLKNGSYPWYLKKRILSDTGHLSNETSGKLISEVMHNNLKYVLLGHLSKENNLPELARETVMSQLISSGADCAAGFQLLVSEREEVSQVVEV